MTKPLTHRPFEAMEQPKKEVTVIRRRRTDPESGLRLVDSIRQTPIPTDPHPTARMTPDPSEPEEVAGKKKGKKWTEEQKAKLRATWAAKKKRGEPVGKQAHKKHKKRSKKTGRRLEAQITAHFKPRARANTSRTAAELLGAAIEALEELRRRLQALSL